MALAAGIRAFPKADEDNLLVAMRAFDESILIWMIIEDKKYHIVTKGNICWCKRSNDGIGLNGLEGS
jgi:hypothetical protein